MSRSVKKHSFIGYSPKVSESWLKHICHRNERQAVRQILSRNVEELDDCVFPTKQIHSSNTWSDSVRDSDSKCYFGDMKYEQCQRTENAYFTWMNPYHNRARNLYETYKKWMRK